MKKGVLVSLVIATAAPLIFAASTRLQRNETESFGLPVNVTNFPLDELGNVRVAEARRPKSKVIDAGEILLPANTTGIIGVYDLDGFDTVSMHAVVLDYDGPGFDASLTTGWRNDPSLPFVVDRYRIRDCNNVDQSFCFSPQDDFGLLGGGMIVDLNVLAKELQLAYRSFGGPNITVHVVLYLRRQG